MQNVELTQAEQEFYNNKRFPKRWQAFLASALMRTVGSVIATSVALVVEVLISFNAIRFSSEFGVEMFNAVLSQMCMMLPIPLVLVFLFKKDVSATLKLDNDINIPQILLLVLVCIGAFIPAQVINSIVVNNAQIIFGPPKELSGVTNSQNIVQFLSEIVIVGFLPGICEEIFYRGYVLSGLERKGKNYALFMSAIMFAIMHANFQQMTYAFLLGLILGFVVLKTRSLLASIVMHSTLNVISVILCYGPINDFYVAFNQEIITVALVVSPPILVTSIILFSLYTKKRNARLGISNDLPSFESIKEKPFEKILAIILFATFVLTNIVDAISAW